VFANEISFSGLLMDVSRVIPPTAALTQMTATSQEPAPTTGGTTLLTGRIDVAGIALDYDTIASWLTRLERVRGWVNPWVTSIADPEVGPITYTSGFDLTQAVVTRRGRQAEGAVGAG
jgi:Tfp pilus assembly protein PilN